MNDADPRMRADGWRRAGPDDMEAVRAFASPRETWATGFSGRILGGDDGLDLPSRGRGGLYLHDDPGDSVNAAVLLTTTGTAFPLLGGPASGAAVGKTDDAVEVLRGVRASRVARSFAPHACVGLEPHVEALEAVMAWKPTLRVRYRSLYLDAVDWRPPSGYAGPAPRRACAADLDSLLDIAEAYELEEVVTPLHRFDPDTCKAAQARSLAEHIVYLVESDGRAPLRRVVARAQTNAHGWNRDQIGGVYVQPELRGRGIGAAVVSALVGDILSRGRSASLFVKKTNEQALRLYANLGFRLAGDFRVDYFS